MKTKITKLSALLLAALMLLGSVTACAEAEDTPDDKETTATTKDPSDTAADETEDPNQYLYDAMDALGEIDYGKKTLSVIYSGFENELVGVNEILDSEGGNSQVINDAVYKRNKTLEDKCNLKFVPLKVDGVETKVRNESMAPTKEFQFIDDTLGNTATKYATQAYLAEWTTMGIDLEQPWWDSGTADFRLKGGVYFMSGSVNFGDDNVTYVLIFNKQMQKDHQVPNPYQTVRDKEWTLEYFNQVIQGVSSDSDGKQGYDENDTYGFLTTWEYGNTFFLGCGLRYIINDETVDEPTLYLSENQARMEKALQVLELSRSIYHDNNAAFMSPPGEEGKGVTAFQESRGLFFGEVVAHLTTLNREMKGDYGIVPVPKYDKEQENYNTWTHASGSTFSIISSVPESERETMGQIMSAFAILSHQYVKPAYYDTVLTSRQMRDADSAEMMDIIFANRVYEMSFYFNQFGFFEIFKTCVNDDLDNFSSSYSQKSQKKKYDRDLKSLLGKLPDIE